MTDREQLPPPAASPDRQSEAYKVLTGTAWGMRTGRRILSSLPASPRCKLCGSPFRGPISPLMRAIGKGPWPKNPKYCSWCFKEMITRRDGAEIECSLLFADVRGSTSLAETMSPGEFNAAMSRFFDAASRVLFDHDAFVDKYVGDEVIGIFIPALAGELHARRAVAAGVAMLKATGHDRGDPWVPIGVGVNRGTAYVGAVGVGENLEFTAMGDAVNVTARLASAAGAGEVLVSAAAAAAAQLETGSREHRQLALKGKSEATEVIVLRAEG